jgi:Kelch motif protein
MGTARNYQAGTRLADGRVLVVGGQHANGVTLASAEIYDPEPRRGRPREAGLSTAEIFDPTALAWTGVQPMTTGRNGPAASAISNANSVDIPAAQARIQHALVSNTST